MSEENKIGIPLQELKIRVQENTDNIDIDSKCIGIDSWVEGDSLNLLNSNRGLHIQIRHNGDPETFYVANEIAKKIVAAFKNEVQS